MSSNFTIDNTEINKNTMGTYHGMNGRIELGGKIIGLVTGINWTISPSTVSQYDIMGSQWSGPKAISGLTINGSFQQGFTNTDLMKIMAGIMSKEDGTAEYYLDGDNLEDASKDPITRSQDGDAKPIFSTEFDLIITNAKMNNSDHNSIIGGQGQGGSIAVKLVRVKMTNYSISGDGSDFWMNDVSFIADYMTVIDNK